MRIELPLPSWNESSHRPEDDAHTLTVEASASEWSAWQWANEVGPTLRTHVAGGEPVVVTITL